MNLVIFTDGMTQCNAMREKRRGKCKSTIQGKRIQGRKGKGRRKHGTKRGSCEVMSAQAVRRATPVHLYTSIRDNPILVLLANYRC